MASTPTRLAAVSYLCGAIPCDNGETKLNAKFISLAYGRLRYLLVRQYGDELSADDELVLRDGLITLAAQMLSGERTGRYAVGLPCGAGKTTAIRSILWAIHRLEMDVTVIVACYKVEQLCALMRQLKNEDFISEAKVGLRHSYEYDEVRAAQFLADPEIVGLPQDHASERSEGHNRQFLLVTHEAIKGANMPEWLDRDLTFYDESLIISEARVFTLLAENRDGLFGEINKLRDLADTVNDEKYGDAARWMLDVKERLLDALKAIDETRGVHILKMPTLTPQVVKRIRRLLPESSWPMIYRLLDYANEDLRVRKDSHGHALITYRISVPDELKNVIVTDASDPIRELVQYDKSIQSIEHAMPALAKFADSGLGVLKRYDDVNVYHRRSTGGRAGMAVGIRSKAQADLREVRKIIDSRPGEDFLIFTYKAKEGSVNFTQMINRYLGDRMSRVSILTWGNETALNRYGHITNVIMLGVMLLPMDALAGAYMGQKRNLREADATEEPTLRSLRYSEASHLIYQGANRGAMRFSAVDSEGQTQARSSDLWVIHYDGGLKERLDRVMPGAKWHPWLYEDMEAGVYETALDLAEYLRKRSTKVSSRRAKADLNSTLSRKSWQSARDVALGMVPWQLEGQSMTPMFSNRAKAL